MSAAPSLLNPFSDELESNIFEGIGSQTEPVLHGTMEDEILCSIKAINSVIEDTDYAFVWKVIGKYVESGVNRVKACRKNAENIEEEIL